VSLDEYIYGKFAKYLKHNRKSSAEIAARIVHLDDIRQKLIIVSRAITGCVIEIFIAEREGGYKNNNFFLPESMSLFSTRQQNLWYYLYRIIYLSIQKELGLNSTEEGNTLEESRIKAAENSSTVLKKLFEDFPVAKEWHDSFYQQIQTNTAKNKAPDLTWLYGKWMKDDTGGTPEKKLNNIPGSTFKKETILPKTILKANAVEEVTVMEVDKKQQEDYVLNHYFEKVDTADEFSGVWRDFDGEDQLEDHQDALDELNMRFTVRVDDPTHSVYQAEFTENTTISESAEVDGKGYHIKYDEWDYSKRRYKEGFCKLYPLNYHKADVAYYKNTIKDNATILNNLRKMLANVNNKMQQLQRQTQGESFDIDATTDMLVDIHTKRTPTEKIYNTKRKRDKDISILLLLDVSLSSDGYAAGERVIDVEKQASILFGEILNEYNIDFSVNCFYSKTRNFSNYVTLKDFDEDWNNAKYKIGGIDPQGYTRIGTALRHSGALLDKRNAKNKWVILISDGKPNDFDKYEGRYGINDVKQALRELKQKNINSYALAIEAQAKYYLPQMFGQNHYQILTTPVDLLSSLVKFYEKLKCLP